MKKISNIEVVEEIKYLLVIVQAKGNVFEGQKNEIMKKIKRLIVMTNSVIEKSCHRVMMGKHIGKEWYYQARCMEQRKAIVRHERRRNR